MPRHLRLKLYQLKKNRFITQSKSKKKKKMPKTSREYIKKHVIRSLGGSDSYSRILKYVKKKSPSLWAKEKNEYFLENNLILTIYKDTVGIGYKKIIDENKDWIGFSHNSLNHNVQQMRLVLADWGKKQIKIGDESLWNRNAKSISKIKELSSVNLWMDSTDVPLTTPRGTSKKDRYWSYKCNKLGRRFQLIFDGKSICRGLYGGYSPKVHDSTWCEVNRTLLQSRYRKGVIISDCHYDSISKSNKDPIFICPKPNVPIELPKTSENDSIPLIKDIKRNKQIRNLRAKVENPFAQIKNKFKALSKPFKEGPEQQGALFCFAVGLHNHLNQ